MKSGTEYESRVLLTEVVLEALNRALDELNLVLNVRFPPAHDLFFLLRRLRVRRFQELVVFLS